MIYLYLLILQLQASPNIVVEWNSAPSNIPHMGFDDHPLANMTAPSLTPWIGWETEKWLFLGTTSYHISNDRNWTAAEKYFSQVGIFSLSSQLQRKWHLASPLLCTFGVGMSYNHPLIQKKSSIFTEEEQSDFDQQNQEIFHNFRSVGTELNLSIQYPLSPSFWIGLSNHQQQFFQWTQTSISSSLSISFLNETDLIFRWKF